MLRVTLAGVSMGTGEGVCNRVLLGDDVAAVARAECRAGLLVSLIPSKWSWDASLVSFNGSVDS